MGFLRLVSAFSDYINLRASEALLPRLVLSGSVPSSHFYFDVFRTSHFYNTFLQYFFALVPHSVESPFWMPPIKKNETQKNANTLSFRLERIPKKKKKIGFRQDGPAVQQTHTKKSVLSFETVISESVVHLFRLRLIHTL